MMLRPLAVACAFGIVVSVGSGPVAGTAAALVGVPPDSVVLDLITGAMPITPTTTREYLAVLRASRRPLDGFALFRRDLRTRERAFLATHGLVLLSHAETGVYRVRLRPSFNPETPEVRPLFVAAARLRPQDRVMTDVWRGVDSTFRRGTMRGDTNYLVAAGDSLRLRITVDAAEPDSAVQRRLRANATRLSGLGPGQWTVTAARGSLGALASASWVRWIDVFMPGVRRNTDVTRGGTGSDTSTSRMYWP